MASASDVVAVPVRTSLPEFTRVAASGPVGLGIVLLGVLQQAVGHLNGDVSWFITFAEKVLDGARAYADVSDPNLPAAFLVYMPAALVARWLHVRAEAATVVEVLLLVAASLTLAGRILRPMLPAIGDRAGLLRNAVLWILLVVPGFGFAEREHFALIAIVPLLAVYAMRADGHAIGLALAAAAGIGGGIALAFKPHYALAIGGAAVAAMAWRRAPLLWLRAETFAIAGVAVLYGALLWFVWPDYLFVVLPLALKVYASARNGLAATVMTPLFVANLGLLVAVCVATTRLRLEGRVVVVVAASAGFLVTFVLQGKGWFNHAYPGLALGELAALVLWIGQRDASAAVTRFGRLCVLPALVCAPFFSAITMNAPGAEEYPGLYNAIRANAPSKPRIAALAEQLDVAHPVVRQLGGTWIGRQNALWISNCVNQIFATKRIEGAQRADFEEIARRDRRDFTEDVASGRPDVLLVESAALRSWAMRQPQFAHLLDPFHKASSVGDIEVWTRTTPR